MIGSLVVDCKDFPTMMRSQQATSHYLPREPASAGSVVSRDSEGKSADLSFYHASRLKRSRNRLHIDLYSDDHKAEVKRFLKLGATLHRRPEPGEDLVVLADPEGNLFSVVDTSARKSAQPADPGPPTERTRASSPNV